MVNRSFSSHYYDYPMGRVPRGMDKGWKKHGFSSPCPESAGPNYLPGPSVSALVLPYGVTSRTRADDRGGEIQFFPFYRPSPRSPSRKRGNPCDAPHAVAVGRPRMQIFRRIVSASCPLLSPLPPRPQKIQVKLSSG